MKPFNPDNLQAIVDEFLAAVPAAAFDEYDDAFVCYTVLRGELLKHGACEADLADWLRQSLSSRSDLTTDRTMLDATRRALCDAFGYDVTIDRTNRAVMLRPRSMPIVRRRTVQ